MFPEVTRLLTSHTGNTSNSEDILASACYTVRNLMASLPGMAKQHFSSSMVNNIINLCRSRWVGGLQAGGTAGGGTIGEGTIGGGDCRWGNSRWGPAGGGNCRWGNHR